MSAREQGLWSTRPEALKWLPQIGRDAALPCGRVISKRFGLPGPLIGFFGPMERERRKSLLAALTSVLLL